MADVNSADTNWTHFWEHSKNYKLLFNRDYLLADDHIHLNDRGEWYLYGDIRGAVVKAIKVQCVQDGRPHKFKKLFTFGNL